MPRAPTTYWDYIKVESLLALQSGIAEREDDLENDEVTFIVVHQVDELWFKLALRELVKLRDLFAAPTVPEQALASAVRALRRTETVFRHLASHFEVMETLTTRDYLAFRDKLSPASGFQSAQLREIEILLGLDDAVRIPLGHEHSYMQALRNVDGSDSPASLRVKARLADTPTVKRVIDDWLYRTPIRGSHPGDPSDAKTVRAFLDAYSAAQEKEARGYLEMAQNDALTEADKLRLQGRYEREIHGARAFLLAEDAAEEERPRVSRIRAALVFIESYRELPLLAWPREVVDAIVALEQSFVVFRQRHARMVERVIGRRTGTGGSAGVEYLDRTALEYRVFRDIWAVRTLLLRHAALPPLEHPERYDFAGA